MQGLRYQTVRRLCRTLQQRRSGRVGMDSPTNKVQGEPYRLVRSSFTVSRRLPVCKLHAPWIKSAKITVNESSWWTSWCFCLLVRHIWHNVTPLQWSFKFCQKWRRTKGMTLKMAQDSSKALFLSIFPFFSNFGTTQVKYYRFSNFGTTEKTKNVAGKW